MTFRCVVPILAAALTLLFGHLPAQAEETPATSINPCGSSLIICAPTQIGVDSGISQIDWATIPRYPGDDGKAVDTANRPRFEYATTIACTDAPPGTPAADTMCPRAVMQCQDAATGLGPLTRVWQRTVEVGRPPSDWTAIGLTCYADAVPGSRPTITMAMIRQAFHLTPWATPRLTTQPKGDVTLVGLDTYYQVNWSTTGYQPEEIEPIDPAAMLGYQVEIKVKLDHFTYLFGDGHTFGPTPYEGGVYPTGTITHQYQQPGTYPAQVETTFGAEFRINGGAWAPIPDTVTVPGPTTTVTVKTARAQLVSS